MLVNDIGSEPTGSPAQDKMQSWNPEASVTAETFVDFQGLCSPPSRSPRRQGRPHGSLGGVIGWDQLLVWETHAFILCVMVTSGMEQNYPSHSFISPRRFLVDSLMLPVCSELGCGDSINPEEPCAAWRGYHA